VGRERFSIGEFSQRSGLTARALRLYDEAGLLAPDFVDDATGYRYYARAQLDRAFLIAALRSAGVPLSTVAVIVDRDAADAHVLVDRWWGGVRAEHLASAAALVRIHHLLDGRSMEMSDERPTSAGVSRWEAAVRAVLRADVASLNMQLAAAPELIAQRGPEGRTLLSDAARAVTHDHALPSRDAGEEHHAVVARLLAAGADPSAPEASGWTPLHSAAISGNERLAVVLLDAGASVDALVEDRAGSTPLAYALFYGHTATAQTIAGERPSPDDLRTAAGLGDLARMHRWLDDGRPLPRGADAGMDFYGPTEWFPPRQGPVDDQLVVDESLVWSSRSGRVEAMELLVAHGADVNSSPYRGTPLLWAVYGDRVQAAAWLLDHGADPDLRHDFGGEGHGVQAVAMHLAAQYGSLGCLQLLLERGADATITDGAHDSTPLGWARFGEQPEAAVLLERHIGS
jgi:ankyrin repeat protein